MECWDDDPPTLVWLSTSAAAFCISCIFYRVCSIILDSSYNEGKDGAVVMVLWFWSCSQPLRLFQGMTFSVK